MTHRFNMELHVSENDDLTLTINVGGSDSPDKVVFEGATAYHLYSILTGDRTKFLRETYLKKFKE